MPSDNRTWQEKLNDKMAADPSVRKQLDHWADQWEVAESKSIALAPQAFTYAEWAIIFGLVDFARTITSGLDFVLVLSLEAALAYVMFRHFVNKFFSIPQHFGTRDALWAGLLTRRMVMLLAWSLVGTPLLLIVGWRISTMLQNANRYELPIAFELSADPPLSTLSMVQMPGATVCTR